MLFRRAGRAVSAVALLVLSVLAAGPVSAEPSPSPTRSASSASQPNDESPISVLVKTLAQILDLKFKRIQFTPDLMPAHHRH